MRELVRDLGTALIWISHDLATVSSLASRILVMYAGRIIEDGPTAAVLRVRAIPTRAGCSTRCPRAAEPGRDLRADPGLDAVAAATAARAARSGRAAARATGCARACPTSSGMACAPARCHHPLASSGRSRA